MVKLLKEQVSPSPCSDSTGVSWGAERGREAEHPQTPRSPGGDGGSPRPGASQLLWPRCLSPSPTVQELGSQRCRGGGVLVWQVRSCDPERMSDPCGDRSPALSRRSGLQHSGPLLPYSWPQHTGVFTPSSQLPVRPPGPSLPRPPPLPGGEGAPAGSEHVQLSPAVPLLPPPPPPSSRPILYIK